MQHVEFFDKDHFQHRYRRYFPGLPLGSFIDFFWETDFDELLQQHPGEFSDALFPNIGYTYLINLGTPFIMQVGEAKFPMKSDGFLQRHKAIECYHRQGNQLFGIKFRVSPVLFEKKIDFYEYRESIYPLSYLIDASVIEATKKAPNFGARVSLLSAYFEKIVERHSGSIQAIRVVTAILDHWLLHKTWQKTISFVADNDWQPQVLYKWAYEC